MEGEESRLRYVDSQEHKGNLRAALDQCSVREPDLELVSADGRRVFGHRSVLGIFSPLLVDLFSHTPCCQMATIVFPDTSSEILSHLLNMLYTGSTEASSESMSILAGEDGVFATASLLGITITPEQKVIEVLDRRENILEEEEEADQIVIEGEERIEELPNSDDMTGSELAERMEICPSIPMFDLAGLATLAQWHGQQERGEGEEVPEGPVENEDYYICKLTSCQTMIMFENCGARSKILNHYTSHFQRELEDQFGHLLTEEMQCTLCSKQLGNYIKSKVWSHIGVTHDKTNEILASKGIPPIAVNIRGSKISKRKASDVFPEEVSPRFETGFTGALQQPILATPTPSAVAGELAAAWRDGSGSWGGGGGRNNCCRICGQVTQNRKRLLKHYCTRHFIDRLGALEYSFIVRNKCVECGRDFVGAKKSSKVIHIGVEHKQIFPILELEFGQSDGVPRAEDYRPAKRPRPLSQDTSSPMVLPSSSSPLVIPKANKSPSSSLPMIPVQHNLPRVQLDMSNAMMEIQARGNECLVCGKRFDLFRSMLLPHYCGHFYKEIAQGHEEYFTEENCKLCGATATKRKSRIIHLGVKHELVLPYIQEVIKMRGEQNEDEEDVVQVKEEEVVDDKDQEVEELGDSSLVEVKEESEEEDLVVRMDDDVKDDDEQEEKEEVQATEEERVVSRIIESVSQEISNGSVEKDEEEVPEGTLTPLPSSPPCITVPSPRPRTHLLLDQGTLESATLLKSMPAEPPVAKLVVPSLPAQKSLASKVTETLPTASSSVPSSPVPSQSLTKVLAKPDEDIRPAREDELSEATLGLTCRICEATEASTHEMLTHYCNHFTEQLKQIAEKNVNEEHKCKECGKMLGNNKRRLLHFGVHHAHVLPLVSSHLRALGPQEEERDEDGFEVTLDPIVNSPVKRPKPSPEVKEPKVVKETKIIRKASGTPRTCEICGVKRNTNANLLRHYSREHFVLEIEEGYGHLMDGATCSLCHTVVDCTARGVGDAEKWVHLGVRHGVTNTLLQQQGWNPVHLRDKQENGTIATPAVVTSNGVANKEVLQVPTPSPPPPPPESPELFSCDLCDKKTKNQNLLNLHLIAMHYKKEILASYGNPEHQCNVCRKNLPNADAFAFHIGQDHNKLAEFTIVKKRHVKAKLTNGEIVNGDAGGQFSCFKCGSVGKDRAALYGHYSLHHFSQELMGEFGVQTLCPVSNCGHTSDSGTTWIEHIGEVHSAVEKYLPVEHHLPSPPPSPSSSSSPANPLLCPLKCDINFHTEQQLTDHFRIQHGFSQEVVQKMREKNFALKTKDV